jgi:ABC-2 type transport system ATP-binding protein
MRTASADAGPAVDFRDVVKVYNGRVTALDHVSFEIARGETVALLGPNGAGKSTAIDTMLGLRAPTSGQVRVLGTTPADAAAEGKIGGMVQTGGLPEGAKVGADRGRAHGSGSGGSGSGLTGLTERARSIGAEISAGEGRGGKGFRLLVRIPARRFSAP